MGTQVSVVLPAYNERDNLVELLPETSAAMRDAGFTYEIIVVDDGSTDGTGELLREWQGTEITGATPHSIVKSGIAQSPEGRRLFSRMSVTENLEMGAFQRTDKENFAGDMERVFTLFPRLQERRSQKASERPLR